MEIQALGWGQRLTVSRWLYPTWLRHVLIGLVAVPAELKGRHPGKNCTTLHVFRSYNWERLHWCFFLWSCKIENITHICAPSSARRQLTAAICSHRCSHSHLSTRRVNVWAQMQTHMLSLHCSQGADGYWRLKVYCGWLANYYTSWGI